MSINIIQFENALFGVLGGMAIVLLTGIGFKRTKQIFFLVFGAGFGCGWLIRIYNVILSYQYLTNHWFVNKDVMKVIQYFCFPLDVIAILLHITGFFLLIRCLTTNTSPLQSTVRP